MSTPVTVYRLTVDEYYRKAQAGIFTKDDRVELIEGQIVQMTPIGGPHAPTVDIINNMFAPRVQGRAIVRVQNPLYLEDYSEPQPDLMLLRPRRDYYRQAHPGPADVLLRIEVSDSSVEYDRDVKIPLYARAGIPEMWLTDLTLDVIDVYRSPLPTGYQQVQRFHRGQRFAPQALPDLEINVQDILGS
ncbi:MAG: Uma2 family endonuclease [Dehalococcoidia bacterium]|nr:Uma2 family endonuclease [Dehalococcoidia bacterium]